MSSSRIKILNNGLCSKRRVAGHIDCLLGCTHPGFLGFVVRILLFPFQIKPIIGYCEFVSEECLIEPHYGWPDFSADEVTGSKEALRIQAETIKKYRFKNK